MTLKEYLLMLEPNSRVEINGKNNLPFGSCTASLYLEYEPKKRLKKKVLYDGLDFNREYVVVIDEKVKICK